MTYNLKNKIFFQPDLSFNNNKKWMDFCDSRNWNEAIKMFEDRISDFFFDAIRKLYEIDSTGKLLKVHNFPISSICWSLIDLLAQLEAGQRVNGVEIDDFLERNSVYFTGINEAVVLAHKYYSIVRKKRYFRRRKKVKKHLTVFAIFRNDPFHSAMVRRPGGLDNNQPKIFNIQNVVMIQNGIRGNYDIIIEDPIKLYKALQDYLNFYLNQVKIDSDLQKKFKKCIENLYKLKFKKL